MSNIDAKLQQILDIGIALTAEKDSNKLLDLIIQTAMDLTSSDGGALYILKDNMLHFRIMKTTSKGIDLGKNGEVIDLPPVPLKKENICAYAALTGKSLIIEDVYESDLFDFSGPKKYDELNEYRTRSMVAIPMIGKKGEIVGVMQLLNATDENKNVRPFSDDETHILMALASQTAISLTNMAYMEEITQQMWSFTEAMTEAIDARTPYNASHTRKVAEYAGMIVDYINKLHHEGREEMYFDDEHKEQIVLAAFLHDIGKMIVPIEVMNKQTRLDGYLEGILSRLEKVELLIQIDELNGLCTAANGKKWRERVELTRQVVDKANSAGFLSDELINQIEEICSYKYNCISRDETIPFIMDDEKECLLIKKGTLTAKEREIMESHVVMTERILSKVYFNRSFSKTPVWAAQHHECLNGKGYPKGIDNKELGIEARILAVSDICDALLATDRPYKKPLPKEKAFEIMQDMAKDGMIDGKIVGYIMDCIK